MKESLSRSFSFSNGTSLALKWFNRMLNMPNVIWRSAQINSQPLFTWPAIQEWRGRGSWAGFCWKIITHNENVTLFFPLIRSAHIKKKNAEGAQVRSVYNRALTIPHNKWPRLGSGLGSGLSSVALRFYAFSFAIVLGNKMRNGEMRVQSLRESHICTEQNYCQVNQKSHLTYSHS